MKFRTVDTDHLGRTLWINHYAIFDIFKQTMFTYCYDDMIRSNHIIETYKTLTHRSDIYMTWDYIEYLLMD